MPVGVVGRGEHVVVQIIIVELRRPGGVGLGVLGVGEVHGHQRLREDLAHGLRARGHQKLDVEPGFFAAQGAVGLVAELHHGDGDARVFQLLQAVGGVVVERLGLGLDVHVLPRERDHLLAGVGPEVGIVEVDDQFQPGLRRALADLDGRADVVVAAAEAVPGRVAGMVPDAHADVRHAVVGEDLKEILLLAGEVVVFDAARLLGQHRGHVHAEDEVLRQLRHGLDAERVARDGRFFRAAAGQQRQREDRQNPQQFFHRNSLLFFG